MPPTYMLIAMIAMIVLNFLFPLAIVIRSPWNLPGIIPIVLGVYISVVAEKSFRDARTTVTPFAESSILVTNGMYRISRNPMYLGFILILIGIAIMMRSLTPFAIIPVFLVVIEKRFVTTEERMLAEKFGRQYTDYKRKTRRWL
jgi:protein-S-isoprenylcysteine O-methyltransferase Ste14